MIVVSFWYSAGGGTPSQGRIDRRDLLGDAARHLGPQGAVPVVFQTGLEVHDDPVFRFVCHA